MRHQNIIAFTRALKKNPVHAVLTPGEPKAWVIVEGPMKGIYYKKESMQANRMFPNRTFPWRGGWFMSEEDTKKWVEAILDLISSGI